MTPEADALIRSLRELERKMWEFANTKPSPQQTRVKTPREMVEYFAWDLKQLLDKAAVLDRPAPPQEER